MFMVKSVGVGSYLAFKLADWSNERQQSPLAGQWFRMVFCRAFCRAVVRNGAAGRPTNYGLETLQKLYKKLNYVHQALVRLCVKTVTFQLPSSQFECDSFPTKCLDGWNYVVGLDVENVLC